MKGADDTSRELGRPKERALGFDPFAHPVWWGALALWLLNDHALKGSGVLPGWLTGKLSDVTALIVLPALIARLTGATSSWGRWLSLLVVGVPFAAINTMQWASDLAQNVLRTAGLPWRLWCDPADLLALTALVIPYQWSGLLPRAGTNTGGLRWNRIRQALGVGAATVASLATSGELEAEYETTAYVTNGTYDYVDLEIFRTRETLDCEALDEMDLDVALLDAPEVASMSPFGRVPLDRNPGIDDPDWEIMTDAGPWPDCEALVLRATSLSPVVVSWVHSEPIHVDEYYDSNDPHGLVIERVGRELVLGGTSLITVERFEGSLP